MSNVHCDQCGCDFESHTCPGCAAELTDEVASLRAENERITGLARTTADAADKLRTKLAALRAENERLRAKSEAQDEWANRLEHQILDQNDRANAAEVKLAAANALLERIDKVQPKALGGYIRAHLAGQPAAPKVGSCAEVCGSLLCEKAGGPDCLNRPADPDPKAAAGPAAEPGATGPLTSPPTDGSGAGRSDCEPAAPPCQHGSLHCSDRDPFCANSVGARELAKERAAAEQRVLDAMGRLDEMQLQMVAEEDDDGMWTMAARSRARAPGGQVTARPESLNLAAVVVARRHDS